ncbi:SCP domain-containing protein [Heracleum sosnowskyi]|uniref:SCP domain-containing protein n=1 Tax=Heracleum sosnowskyi TaxID=360622 RepID=A0AAD8M570_9APIA|nr:SCP domain-containing protein [Heracleum sosnowskyi]
MARLLLTLIIISLAISQSSSQGSLPSSTTTPTLINAAAQEYLDAHNSARAEVGVQPLNWSVTLKNTARLIVLYQRDKNNCKFANLSGRKYGANQSWNGGTQQSPQEVVLTWVSEKKNYTYANNSCLDDKCGLYKQVVWKKSLELGCAQASCADSTLTICFYNPPGNIVGEKPY